VSKKFGTILLRGIFKIGVTNPYFYTMDFLFAKEEDATEEAIEQVKNILRQDFQKELSKISITPTTPTYA
jgi:hypothetical protein